MNAQQPTAADERILVIDCASEACSVALFEGGALIAGELRMLGRGHAEQLVPMIAALPGKGRATRIAVDHGPGSFTGIRVGLAAARGLGLGWQAPVEGYSSLALIAAMARADHPGLAIDVVMNGGHGEWFFQPFAADGSALQPIASLLPEAVIAASQGDLVVGSKAGAVAQARGIAARELWPDARCFPLLATGATVAEPTATYGRAPDARLPAA